MDTDINSIINAKTKLIENIQSIRQKKIKNDNENELLEITNLENSIDDNNHNLINSELSLNKNKEQKKELLKKKYILDKNFEIELSKTEKFNNDIIDIKNKIKYNKKLLIDNSQSIKNIKENTEKELKNLEIENNNFIKSNKEKLYNMLNNINEFKNKNVYDNNRLINKINKNQEVIKYYYNLNIKDYDKKLDNRFKNVNNLINFLKQKNNLKNKKKLNNKILKELYFKLEGENEKLLLENERYFLQKNKNIMMLKEELNKNNITKKIYFEKIKELENDTNYINNKNKIILNNQKIGNLEKENIFLENETNINNKIFISKINYYDYKYKNLINKFRNENLELNYKLELNFLKSNNLQNDFYIINNKLNNNTIIKNKYFENKINDLKNTKNKDIEIYIKKNNIINLKIREYHEQIYILSNILKKIPLNYELRKQQISDKISIINKKINKLQDTIKIYKSNIKINKIILEDLKNNYKENKLKRQIENNNLKIKELIEINNIKKELNYVK